MVKWSSVTWPPQWHLPAVLEIDDSKMGVYRQGYRKFLAYLKCKEYRC
jgi:hypothetical protein